METEEKKDGKCCGSKCGCCGGKALAAVALLVIGAIGGYFCCRHCAANNAMPAMSAPVNPAK